MTTLLRNRRHFLTQAGGGIALNWMLANTATAGTINPLAAKKPHFPAKAKRVIFLFMVGGPSQMDLFDPKPELTKRHGQPLPEMTGRPKSQFTTGKETILASTRKFQQHGRTGAWVSDLMPHLADCVDDICFLKSCWCTNTIHAPAMYELHSGRITMGHPSLGSWAVYGLGSESENLPAYCVMPQPEGVLEGGAPCWGAGYLPAVNQGTLLRRGANPVLNLKPQPGVSATQNERTFELAKKLNELNLSKGDTDLEARISSYELAFRMQMHAPEAVDLSQESKETKTLYGLDNAKTADFGTRLLLARRLVERGVRFVSVYSGGGPVNMQWDAHDDLNGNHEKMCGLTDKPIAALLKDLKRLGMLKDTLVVWCSEFGRTPNSQGTRGRDHNPLGYTMWLAGGGAKPGSVGTTDEFGLKAVDRPISVNDYHATILHLLGLDHEKLTIRHNGRDERLTDVAGNVVTDAVV
ncbi:DUF1501 domain-containing protein [Limnoglobus roseus]|uniref:DUF1501 domain-containing protein n=1 Tax=Limnoglobus roseus TaxID=2598579 RepID=A0A5C1A5T4_9BACT|nr:DUF1501 domain-containing protein [Limnoglobus roseus]QEL13192.1 hypothetical protein PX52LOC_00045 [Limnoglobus roseus]